MKDELVVKRLGWAGLQLSVGDQRLVIDLFEERHAMAPLLEEVTGPLPSPDGPVDFALVTHLHADHTDPLALGRSLTDDGLILRPPPAPGNDWDRAATAAAEAGLASSEAKVLTVEPWQSHEIGPFTATAVPASDGFGDPQVSWVVEAAGRRILHAGDTLFHGAWWPIASRFRPFDAVFLPVNGATVDFPHRQPPSPFVVSMDPDQAAAAASMLRANLAVPIHYDGIDQPGVYKPTADAAAKFETAADARGVATEVIEPGTELLWR